MTRDPAENLTAAAAALLERVWSELTDAPLSAPPATDIPAEIVAAIQRSISSKTKTDRYVLPTQLLAKAVNRSLDCRAIQSGRGVARAFDLRSLCHDVIVPFDRRNHAVLGGASEPYVNNPLRIPAVVPEHRGNQKDKQGFDDLCQVLQYAEENPDAVDCLLYVTLRAIQSRLAEVQVDFPVPNRVALSDALLAVRRFVDERSGGLRLQVVCVALLRQIGRNFSLFEEVRAAALNAADQQTGNAADIECRRGDGTIALAVEVKDRALVVRHIQDKLGALHSRGISELLYLASGGVDAADTEAVQALVAREFRSGHNIYCVEVERFLEAALVLLGEHGRRAFLVGVGDELNLAAADLHHRRDWRTIVQSI